MEGKDKPTEEVKADGEETTKDTKIEAGSKFYYTFRSFELI